MHAGSDMANVAARKPNVDMRRVGSQQSAFSGHRLELPPPSACRTLAAWRMAFGRARRSGRRSKVSPRADGAVRSPALSVPRASLPDRHRVVLEALARTGARGPSSRGGVWLMARYLP